MREEVAAPSNPPIRYDDSLKDSEAAALIEFEAMKSRIKDSKDPGTGALARLQGLAVDAWFSVTGETCGCTVLAGKLKESSAVMQEAFFDAWCNRLYDKEAVMQATEFHKKPEDMSTSEFFKQHAQDFYSDLLKNSSPNAVKAQADTPLRAMAPAEIADACARVSQGSGLPPDGQVTLGYSAQIWKGTHSCFPGPACNLTPVCHPASTHLKAFIDCL